MQQTEVKHTEVKQNEEKQTVVKQNEVNHIEQTIKLIPENTHLILNNSNKPDKRLKTTKLIQKSIESNHLSNEKSFNLPLPWDITGQQKLVKSISQRLNLKIDNGELQIKLNLLALRIMVRE